MKKPIKVAAYSYLILLVSGFLIGLFIGLTSQNRLFSNFYYILSMLLIFLIYNGFIILGKKLKSDFLVIVSWIGIILGVLYCLYLLFGGLLISVPQLTEQDSLTFRNQDVSEDIDRESQVYKFAMFVLFSHLITSIVIGVLSILLGIALFKLRKRLKYARSAGILNIVAGTTLFILIGYLIMISAVIMEIILLFEASIHHHAHKNKLEPWPCFLYLHVVF